MSDTPTTTHVPTPPPSNRTNRPVVEAIRYNCHFPTPAGEPFDISPGRIFSEELLPSTAPSSTATSSSGDGVENLTLVIALPILGFVLLVCGTVLCCFFFIRRRRKRARRQRQSSHLYARWNDTTISTPSRQSWDPHAHAQYAYGTGFGFVDADGRGHDDVGFSKPGFVEVAEPTLPMAYGTRSPVPEKGSYGYYP